MSPGYSNRGYAKLYERIPYYHLYDKETSSARRALHRKTRRKVKLMLRMREFDVLPVPRRTQGWITW